MIFSSVQFNSVQLLSRVSLRPHESQHARPPCPSPTPGVYSNPCPLSRWTKLEVSHFLTSDYIKTTVIKIAAVQFSSVQSLSCVQLFATAWMPGLPVHHQLSEFTQTLVYRVGDAIQPSHPLSSPSPPAPNHSQHQGLLQWVNSLHEVAKVLEFQLQH